MIITTIMWQGADLYKPELDTDILFVDDRGKIQKGINCGSKVVCSGIIEEIDEIRSDGNLKITRHEYSSTMTSFDWSQIRYWCYKNQIEDELRKLVE